MCARLAATTLQFSDGPIRTTAREVIDQQKGLTIAEQEKKQLEQFKEEAEQHKALQEREWAKMQESRRNKGYEKRAWWDR